MRGVLARFAEGHIGASLAPCSPNSTYSMSDIADQSNSVLVGHRSGCLCAHNDPIECSMCFAASKPGNTWSCSMLKEPCLRLLKHDLHGLCADDFRQDEAGLKGKVQTPLDAAITAAVWPEDTRASYMITYLLPRVTCIVPSLAPLQVMEPLQLACSMDVPRIAEPALGCLHKLVWASTWACLAWPHRVIEIVVSTIGALWAYATARSYSQYNCCACVVGRWRMHTCRRRAAPQGAWMTGAWSLRCVLTRSCLGVSCTTCAAADQQQQLWLADRQGR